MRTGRLGKLLVDLRAAFVCLLFVAASMPQVAGAHALAGSTEQANQVLHQMAVPQPGQPAAISGHCQLGQDCLALATLVGQSDSSIETSDASSRYLFPQTLKAGWHLSFDPPPPRRHL